jgi:hypothetical protein
MDGEIERNSFLSSVCGMLLVAATLFLATLLRVGANNNNNNHHHHNFLKEIGAKIFNNKFSV